MQAIIDGQTLALQKERSATQMTLGDLIKFLESADSPKEIKGLGDLDSYRGYYSDLAFEPAVETKTATELLEQCKSAMGKIFQGYKGGDYVMGETTPLWLANYGSCGPRIVSIGDDGVIRTAQEDD